MRVLILVGLMMVVVAVGWVGFGLVVVAMGCVGNLLGSGLMVVVLVVLIVVVG